MIDAGRLNKMVTFYKVDETFDDAGKPTETETERVTEWAEFMDQRGIEQVFGDQQGAGIEGAVKIRHNENSETITHAYRMKHKGNVYELTGAPVNVGMRDVELVIPLKRDVREEDSTT